MLRQRQDVLHVSAPMAPLKQYMKIYTDLEQIQGQFPGAFVTIGNFDGVHLGHQKLFSEIVGKARQDGGTSVAITFDPHPLDFLRPGRLKLISTLEHKKELIRHSGIDVLIIIPFTADFAKTTAADFVRRILVDTIGVKELVVGYDYAFGRGRQGDIPFLRERGREHGFSVVRVDALYEKGMLVSSSRIRELVTEGRMRDVCRLLGRCYQIRGEVKIGRQRGGKEVGFPTANLNISEEDLCPKRGVYVTQVIYNGRLYGAISNIGCNPTFGENKLVAETHIFDFDDNIYGKPIKINLLRYLRGEKKFAGVEELSSQIKVDIVTARRVLSRV